MYKIVEIYAIKVITRIADISLLSKNQHRKVNNIREIFIVSKMYDLENTVLMR